ncbi:MAG: hypothetical protein J7621_06795 [Niastella sp.]|nr:hypothetical protein [Niastella sp.]
MDFARQYRLFYNLIPMQPSANSLKDKFFRLFVDQPVVLYNDYFDKGTEKFSDQYLYFEDITSFLIRNNPVNKLTITVSDAPYIYYARKGQTCFVWLHKSFNYDYIGKKKEIEGWIKLHVRWITDSTAFKIVAVEETVQPADTDLDQVPDDYDKCDDTELNATTNLSGCPVVQAPVRKPDKLTQPDNSIIVRQENVIQRSDTVRNIPPPPPKVKKTRKTPRPPSSRFGMEVTFGGLSTWPFNTSFSRRELLDERTNRWSDSGAMAYDVGYTAGLSIHYNLARWIGAGVGYQGLYAPIVVRELSRQVKNYLDYNRVNARDVTVNAKGYHMHLLYASLSLGYLRGTKHAFKFEPLIGQMYTDFLLPNSLEVGVTYPHKQEVQKISLKYPPFRVYGLKFTLQWGLGRYNEGRVRFQLTGQYLAGKSDQPSQQIKFENLPAGVIIPSPDLKMATLQAGFHFTLKKPNNF